MSKTIARLLTSLALAATAWQTPMRQANTLLRLSNHLHRRHVIHTDAGPVAFLSTHPQALDYPANLLTREPETIAWLRGMDDRSILWDVGANVGAYSLYAARRGVRVWAFEPAPASFAALSENIRINRLDGKITALPIALGRDTALSWLRMEATNPGSVAHGFAVEMDGRGTFHQGIVSYSIDEFRRAFDLPNPTHIKIDVDGIEEDILAGATKTLAAPAFRSLLIEVDEHESPARIRIGELASGAGLSLVSVGSPDGFAHRNAIFARP